MHRNPAVKRIPAVPYAGLLVCVLLGLAAVHPLLIAGRLPAGHDTVFHLERLIEFTAQWRQGVLFPRWAPDLLNGYGYPVFNYYAPLSYWLPAALSLAGLPYVNGLIVGLAGAFILAAAAMYLWSRDTLGEGPALAAAAAYVFSPYLLFNLMTRTVLPELTALALLPLVLYGLRRSAVTGLRRYELLTAGATAALILAHNVTAALFAPLAGAYALLLMILQRPACARGTAHLAGRLFGALLGGVLLAAFFWLPALLESSLVQLDRLTALGIFDYRAQFRTLADIFSYPVMADVSPITPYYRYSLGLLAAGLAAAGTVYGLLARRRELAGHLLLFLAVGAACVMLAIPVSAPFWRALPPLQLLQFPWRFTGLSTLCLAWLAGLGALALTRLLPRAPWWPALVTGLLAAGLFAYGINWQYTPRWFEPWRGLSAVDLAVLEQRFGSLGTTTTGEYLPRTVLELPADALGTALSADRLDYAALPAGAQVLQADWQPLKMRLRLALPSAAQVTFRTFAFAGWRAALDGAAAPIIPTIPGGLISIAVPAGEHDLSLVFGSTPARSAAAAISLAALAGCLARGFFPRRRSAARGVPAEGPAPVIPWLTYGAVLIALAGAAVCKARLIDPVLASYPGSTPPGALAVNYGGVLELRGVQADASEPSGGTARVTLYWRAPRSVTSLYSVGLAASDARGFDALWGHADHQSPGDLPVTWWYPGDIVRDVFKLSIPAGTPPGLYTLRAVVYPLGKPADALEIRAAQPPGPARGIAYDVAVIRVDRPAKTAGTPDAARQTPAALLGLGISLLEHSALPEQASAGDRLPVTLVWHAGKAIAQPVQAQFIFTASGGGVFAGGTFEPVWGYDTTLWQPGDTWRGIHLLRIPPVLQGGYSVAVQLSDGSRAELGQITVSAPPHSYSPPAAQYSAGTVFGGLAELAGYDLPAEARVGGELPVTLYWRAVNETEQGFKVFVHLLNAGGATAAGQDSEPDSWRRPTTGWAAGEYITDEHILKLPGDLPAGQYILEIGFYDAVTGQRLAADFGGDHLVLPTPIEVR
ncbi:MAG: 6-pyruvoyl-tetrahydropterin synthase-related protein [Anaerolineae bacterium]